MSTYFSGGEFFLFLPRLESQISRKNEGMADAITIRKTALNHQGDVAASHAILTGLIHQDSLETAISQNPAASASMRNRASTAAILPD